MQVNEEWRRAYFIILASVHFQNRIFGMNGWNSLLLAVPLVSATIIPKWNRLIYFGTLQTSVTWYAHFLSPFATFSFSPVDSLLTIMANGWPWNEFSRRTELTNGSPSDTWERVMASQTCVRLDAKRLFALCPIMGVPNFAIQFGSCWNYARRNSFRGMHQMLKMTQASFGHLASLYLGMRISCD